MKYSECRGNIGIARTVHVHANTMYMQIHVHVADLLHACILQDIISTAPYLHIPRLQAMLLKCTCTYLLAMSHTLILRSSELHENKSKYKTLKTAPLCQTTYSMGKEREREREEREREEEGGGLTEYKILTWVKENTGDIVVMAAASVHLPCLSICQNEEEIFTTN